MTVAGDITSKCVWLQSSTSTFRSSALWPPGYRVRFLPTLQVYDQHDHLYWTAGQKHDIGGGPTTARADRLPKDCRFGDLAWWVVPDGYTGQ